jgi:hypothetical protein
MTGDPRHIELLAQMGAAGNAEASHEPPVSEWWWAMSEAERDQWCSLSVAAASQMDDADLLYAHWREHARDEADRLYIEDRIARVTRLLAKHGRVRVVRRGI